MYGIRKELLHLNQDGYQEHLPEFVYLIDCSLGSNPYGAPKLTFDSLDKIYQYPTDDSRLKKLISSYFSNIASINPNMIDFSCGSIGSLMTLNRMFLSKGKDLICLAPTFSAIFDDFRIYQPTIHTVSLSEENNFQVPIDALIDTIKQFPESYIYLDNPNNPTGQVLPLPDLCRILSCASDNNSFVVIDEAFGDFVGNEYSALNLLNQFKNFACVRTFSKGLGEAGIRLGYIVADKNIVNIFHKLNIPYSKNYFANECACQVLESNWAVKTQEKVLCDKGRILSTLEHISVAHTHPSSPISMLYVEDKTFNLAACLQSVGIRAISCKGYTALGIWAVRLNINKNIDLLCKLLHEADLKVKNTIK